MNSINFTGPLNTTSAGQRVPHQSLLDCYKCPEEFASIEAKANLSDESGFFQFGLGIVCYGRCQGGSLAQKPSDPLFDVTELAEVIERKVCLPFDLTEVVENLRQERYTTRPNSSRTARLFGDLKHSVYYFIRPWLPVGVRKHLQRIKLADWNRLAFPNWPVDHTVDSLLERVLILCMKANGVSSIPFIWFWPDGAPACAVMTHDIETQAGIESCRELMELDDSFEIKASFQVVPEDRYVVSNELLSELRRRGFEINVQDLNHDGNLFRERQEFLRRADRINNYLGQFGAKGFRSAILYRNAEWLAAIHASYDMSFPSAAHLEPQRGGCCTVMPYFIDGIVELPVTTTQDYSLINILGDVSMDLWKRQIQSVLARNGLISFIVHPDYLAASGARQLYRSLLAYLSELRAETRIWISLPGEVADWWRQRNRMKLVSRNGKWRIEGEGSERARLALASISGNRLAYTFEE